MAFLLKISVTKYDDVSLVGRDVLMWFSKQETLCIQINGRKSQGFSGGFFRREISAQILGVERSEKNSNHLTEYSIGRRMKHRRTKF